MLYVRVSKLLTSFNKVSKCCISSHEARSLSTSLRDISTSGAFINGVWVDTPQKFDVFNPSNGNKLKSVSNCGFSECEEAIDRAHDAFHDWSQSTTANQRSKLLRKWFDLCSENLNELAQLLHEEQGKPFVEAKGEVSYGCSFIEWFSEEARRLDGHVVEAPTRGKQILLTREPVGVAALITPWNFPNAMIARKASAALAAGCTCVVKPAEDTPLSALALAFYAEKAGLPPGVLNILPADSLNSVLIGETLCASEKVSALSFTGSTAVGKRLYALCASTCKKLSLELGGNAPFIVFKSADIDLAVAGCIASKFRNSGQTCVSTNRVLVEKCVKDEFVEKLSSKMRSMLVRSGSAPRSASRCEKSNMELGPIINRKQFDRIKEMLSDAKSKGATVISGDQKGNCINTNDLFLEPVLLTNVGKGMKCFDEEIFGPILTVASFSSEDEAITMANDSRVGLAAYFYSTDLKQCWRVSRQLQSGMVGVNEALLSCAEGAFGGVKESGLGREGSRFGCDDFMDIKYICFGNLV